MLSGVGGTMIKHVEKVISSQGDFKIVCGIGSDVSNIQRNYKLFQNLDDINIDVDVIIDFSHFSFTHELVNFALNKKIPIVICTTGILQEDEEYIAYASEFIPIVKSANMSIGINTLISLLKEVSSKMYSMGYDIEILEKHHNKKIDSPSGTAIMLADTINNTMDSELEYVYDRTKERVARKKDSIGITSVRGGSIPGEHSIIFAGNEEVIEFKHTAYSKEVFAKGALTAAMWICDKEKGIYSMENVLNDTKNIL